MEPGTRPASDEVRARVAALVEEVGEGAAAKRLGIAHATVSRILAARPLRPGTLALLREALGAS